MQQYLHLPPTKSEAKRLQAKHYFTGKPCSHGHTVPRHVTGTCTSCQQRANKAWAERNPVAIQNIQKAYAVRDPVRARSRYTKHWRAKRGLPEPLRPKPTHCECCGSEATGPRKMHLDHCHTTGKFRGWLCDRCNLGIGAVGDTVPALERALDYLRRNGSS